MHNDDYKTYCRTIIIKHNTYKYRIESSINFTSNFTTIIICIIGSLITQEKELTPLNLEYRIKIWTTIQTRRIIYSIV